MSGLVSTVAPYLARAAAYSYGLFIYSLSALLTLWDKTSSQNQERHDKDALDKASHSLWDPDSAPSGLSHEFVTLPSGTQLHYLLSHRASPTQNAPSKPLIVFVHGFPDSCHIWTTAMTSSLAQAATLVALDLPGYGGSDSIASYGPDGVLNAVAEAIVLLKQQYLPAGRGHCILVGHDWGGVVTTRLASECLGLVDRAIVLNSTHIPHATENIARRVRQSRYSFTQWTRRPWDLQLLRQSLREIEPVGTQLLLRSSYIYMFQLPLPTARIFPSVVEYLLSVCHRGQYGNIPSLPASLAAAAMACSNGPSPAEINNAKSPSNKSISEPRKAYRASVLARAQRGGDWDEKVRLYKEGLATARWTPSAMVRPYQTQTTPSPSPSSSTSSTTPMKRNSEEEKKRMFKIPTTILWGTDDVALDTRIMLDGIEEHFAPSSSSPGRKSQVVRVPDGQHWIFLEPRKDRVGPRMFERVLFWCVAEGAGKNEDRDGVVGTNDQGSLEACLSEFAADGSVQVTSY